VETNILDQIVTKSVGADNKLLVNNMFFGKENKLLVDNKRLLVQPSETASHPFQLQAATFQEQLSVILSNQFAFFSFSGGAGSKL
jgi:hypothetical protein